MSGTFVRCYLVVIGTLLLAKHYSASAAPSSSSSTEKTLHHDDPSLAQDDSSSQQSLTLRVDHLYPSSLGNDVERRRSNFRGDLGKRDLQEDSIETTEDDNQELRPVADQQVTTRTPNNRLRPDLGKRFKTSSEQTAGTSRWSNALMLVGTRRSGMRRRFRPDLGKRDSHVIEVEQDDAEPSDDVQDDVYVHWPQRDSHTDGGSDQLSDSAVENTPWNNEEFDGEPEVQEQSADQQSRSSSFRGDLGKRRRLSSFRGDLGKRSVRRRRSLSSGQLIGNDDVWAVVDIDNDTNEETGEEVGKRRGASKNSFRGDLGKRPYSSFRGDLGKRGPSSSEFEHFTSLDLDNDDAIASYLSSSQDVDKRPRASSFRGDLGKRNHATEPSHRRLLQQSLMIKRPGPQRFRGDLGKRSRVGSDVTDDRHLAAEVRREY